MKAIKRYFPVVLIITPVQSVTIIQMKATEQYFPVVKSIMQVKGVSDF